MSYYSERELTNTIRGYLVRDSNFSVESLNESRQIRDHYDFFLSHSSADFKLVQGLYNKLKEKGFIVFLDKIDTQDIYIQEVAGKLKEAMNKSDYILYAHTHNSIDSKWVPWELGYFDSKKGNEKILVMPIINDNGKAKYTGQEYLNQYEEIDIEKLDEINAEKAERRNRILEEFLKTIH